MTYLGYRVYEPITHIRMHKMKKKIRTKRPTPIPKTRFGSASIKRAVSSSVVCNIAPSIISDNSIIIRCFIYNS